MNAVGIDVSKGKSMVAILRPFGEIVSAPFEIKHTASDIHSLVELINSVEGESRIVLEHTGRYYEVLINPAHCSNAFGPSFGTLRSSFLFSNFPFSSL